MVLYIIIGSVNTSHKVRRECLSIGKVCQVHIQNGFVQVFTGYNLERERRVHIKKVSCA